MRSRLSVLILSTTTLISCAHLQPAGVTPPTETPNVPSLSPAGQPGGEQDGVVGHISERKAIPLEVNQYVDRWLHYFQHKGRRHMDRYLARSGRYVGLMKQILKDNGVPEELVYVAMIESGFSFQARSRAKAVGYWQFISGTARRYGLRMNRLIDERRDPIASTHAAAQYLRGLHNLFGQWELALAAYNVGENRVQKIITESYTRDYWEMARRRMLPDETLNYVPKYIAASMIAFNPEKYGFSEIAYYAPYEFDEITFDKPVNLRRMAQQLKINYSEFKMMNPAYKTDHAPLASTGVCAIRVPKGQQTVALAAADTSAVTASRIVARLDQGEDDYVSYRVRRGDNLAKVARRYGVSQESLRKMNNLRGGKLRLGSTLKVPTQGTAEIIKSSGTWSEEVRRPSSKYASRKKAQSRKVHIVRSGETLGEIARTYQVQITELARANQLSRKSTLFVGSKLLIPD